ncbi:MAG TPA: hypothetical protein VHQ20_02375 [Patescibacteria group bacterium]|jgi:hypothetical protein|nr:hypothetical protein [Patescibacteria group bacterium]
MDSEQNKRNDEHVWASVFVQAINDQYGFDYYLVPERGEDSPVDLYCVSESRNLPQLELQLTHAVELPFMAYEETADVNYTEQPTIEAIERKFEKLTGQGEDLSKLILVVQGYMSHKTATKVFTDSIFDKYKHYPFQGIYYAAPSMMSGDTDESFQTGYIIAIKSAFENGFNYAAQD